MSAGRGIASLLRAQPLVPSAVRQLQQPSEAASRYSPTIFSRSQPADVSATWAPKNPFVESWAHRRDNIENEYTWSFRNTEEVGYFILGLGGLAYGFGLWTMRASDAANGYPRRDLIFSPSNTGFVLPDEREW